MTQKDLKRLRSRLPQNYREEIRKSLAAKRLYTGAYITMVLNGKVSVNLDIIEAAILVAENHEKKMEELGRAARGEEKLDKLKFNLQN